MEELGNQTSKTQQVSQDTDQEAKPSEDKAESNPGVRKSSRPRKQSKRVLDSVDCNDIELVSVPVKKKHHRDLKLKIGHKKDILPNGRPFKCSLCESPYINNSPAKAKVKKELQPILKEKFGQLLQLCVKCAIAVNHTENKGPTPEQRAEFEEEGKQFAQHVVQYLNDSAAARLYCSFYQTTKCGCIQCYITGTPANRKRKTSLSGGECGTPDVTEPKLEEGVTCVDDKAEQAQRASYLLSLLKESMAKKQAQNTKKSTEKNQLASDDTANMMKESEKFILSNRVKLKELGICERGCQKVLCYSNNFLHKKSIGNQPRLQRTKGRAALGRLLALQDLHKMRCCEKNCVKLAERSLSKVEHWRQRAQQGQKEMWKVLEEMLTSTDSGKTNCFKFISMVTGCCQTTVQKVYADVLLSKGAAGCSSKREHGMRFHWKRQKELGKSCKAQGYSVTTPLDQPEASESLTISCSAATSDSYIDPAMLASQTGTCDPAVTKELQRLTMVCQAQRETKPELLENFEENGGKEDIKETFLQLFENIKDAQDIANVQHMLAILNRDLKIKQGKEHTQQGFSSQVSVGSDVAAVAMLSSLGSSSSSTASISASLMSSNISQTPASSSSVPAGINSQAIQDMHMASIPTSKIGRPFVHIKVQKTVLADQKPTAPQLPQPSCREQKVVVTSSTDLNCMQSAQSLAHSVKKEVMQVVDLYSIKSETGSSQILNQPLILSSLTTNPLLDSVQPKAAVPISLPLVIVSSTISSLVGSPPVTISSTMHNSLDQLQHQVGLFQVMSHPDAKNSRLSTQSSQILSVYPQPASLQIQPLSLSTGSSTQNIHFQLVSPLIMGQSDLMVPFNQAGTMSFILPKQTENGSQNSGSYLQTHPLAKVVHKDSLVSQEPAMQQSFQNIPASSATNKIVSSFPLQSECSSSFLNTTFTTEHPKQNKTSSSLSSGVLETSESSQNQDVHLDQTSGAVVPLSDTPCNFHANRTLRSEDENCSSNTQSVAAMNFHSIQNNELEREELHQVNIDHYFPSSLLSQPSGSIIVGTPSSFSSGSFVFDALADSPVKDSLSVSSSSLQQGPFVTSPLLCEMLMRSIAPSRSCISSTYMHDFISSSPSSSLASVLSATSYGSQTPVQTKNSQSVNSAKSSLLISALKSPPVTSTFCQSLNFSTHTTPSTLSNQPVVTSGKVEQASLPVPITIWHGGLLAHSQKHVGRLNRQREPPQVGIVHPHVSGVKSSLGHSATSSPSSSSSISNVSHSSVHSLPAFNSLVAHVNVRGESLPATSSSSSSLSTSGFATLDNINFQAASLQELTEDISASQSYNQQQHLLSLLLNSKQAPNLIDHQSLINIVQQPSQFISSLLGNSTNAVSVNENASQSQTNEAGFQNTIGTGDCSSNLQNLPGQESQNAMTDSSQFLPNQILMSIETQEHLPLGSQTSLSVGNQTPLSMGNQNILHGRGSTQLQTGGHQIFQSVMCSSTGQLKLIPVILSDGQGNTSIPTLFPQNGQLLLNMNACSGLNNLSSLSPQNFNKDDSILLNMSPNSSQNIYVQHPWPQPVGTTQITPPLSLSSSSIQNLHRSVEVSPASKDQTKILQASVMPFGNKLGNIQAQSQRNRNQLGNIQAQSQRDKNQLTCVAASSNESQNANNFESQLSISTSDSVGQVVETVHVQSVAQPALSCTSRMQNVYEKDHSNFQHIHTSDENPSAVRNVFAPMSNSLAKVSRNSEIPERAIKESVTSLTGLTQSRLINEAKTSDFIQSGDFECQNVGSASKSLIEGKPQVSVFNQTQNVEHQVLHSFLECAMQQNQLPFQVMSMVYSQEEQRDSDKVLSSCVSKDLHSQPAFQHSSLDQQLLNISNPNQIFHPVQTVLNKQLDSSQAMSNTVQWDQHMLDWSKVLLNTTYSDTSNDTSSLMPLVQVTKSVSMPSTCMSVQSAISSSGFQHASLVTSCINTSKHRPIRPKLQPVPAAAPAPKISLMLVPDKPGYPAYQLTQLDQALLPVQQERTLPQVQNISQQPLNAVLVSGSSQQLQNNLEVEEKSKQLQSTAFTPGNSQLLLNTLLVPGNSQQSKNSLMISENSQQQRTQKPEVNAAITSQLKSSQQPNVPAQILLVSHSSQGIENVEMQPISRQQSEPLQLSSQSSQQTNTILQPLQITDKECQALVNHKSVFDVLSRHIVTTKQSPPQVTSVSCEVPETSLLQSNTLKDSYAQNSVLQIIPSPKKGYQFGVFSNKPVFVNPIPGDTLHCENVETGNSQSNGCEPGLPRFIPLEVNVSEYGTSQTTATQLSSLPSDPSKVIPAQQSVQSDIQRLNPQVAAQLSGRNVLMMAQQKVLGALASNRQGHPHMTSSSSSYIQQPIQPELNESQLHTLKGLIARSDIIPHSLVDPTSSFCLHSKLSTDDFIVQPMEDESMGKASLNMTQLSSHVGISNSIKGQPFNKQTSCGPVICSNLPPNLPDQSSEIPACTNQLLHRLTQPSVLAVDIKLSTANEDTKPITEPIQYLQCREIIDLTDDSPPLSPSSSAHNKGKTLSLIPLLSMQPQPSKEPQKQIFSTDNNHVSSQQSTMAMQLQRQTLFQQNQLKESQHLQQRWDQLKQDGQEESQATSEIMPQNVSDGTSLPLVSSNKRDQISNLLMLEEIPENIRQELIASLEAHAAGNPDVQLVTRTFTPSDDLSYQGFLSSSGSSQQTEDHFNAITKAISKNKCPSAVVTISTNQRFQQSLARAKSQAPSLALKSLVADSKLDMLTLAYEDDKRLSQTSHGSTSSDLNSEMSSLTAIGSTVNLKQVMDLPSSTQVLSRSSSSASLSSDVNTVAQSEQSSAPLTPTLTTHKFSIASSSPLLLQTTALPTTPAVKSSAGRSVIHPLTSSTVAFMRTTNTPTHAVGPPNITIMSPAHAGSSPLLRFRHESNSASVTTTAMSQVVASVCPNPVSIMTKAQSSGLLKLTTSTSVPVRLQGTQETRQSALLLYPGSGGKDKSAGHLTRKLTLENASQAVSLKEVPSSGMSSANLSSRSVDCLIKSMESPAPSRPKPRKRPSTVMDLLKSKEKLQVTASAISSSGIPVSSTPGPVTLMISGAAGTPNLLVMDSSVGQSRVDPNALNITVKNLQLFGKCSADKNLASTQIPPSSHPTGFTILQPYALPASLSNSCNVISSPMHVTSMAVSDQSPAASVVSIPSTSQLQHQAGLSKTGNASHTISLPAQTSGSPLQGNVSQSKVYLDIFNQTVSQSSVSQPVSGNQRKKMSFFSAGNSLSDKISPKISSTIDEDLKHKKLQEILKTDTGQVQLIGQPQVASGSFNIRNNSPALDFSPQKPQSSLADLFKVEKLKFKITSTKNTNSQDKQQEMSSHKLQPVEDSQRNQPTQGAGTVKKLLLLNDKSSGRDTHPSISITPDLQMGNNHGQLSAEQKQLSPQLLQLMKSKQLFSQVAVDQSVHASCSNSSGHDRSHQLKLLTSSSSNSVSGDASIQNYSGVQQVGCYQSMPNTQLKDQLPTLKTQLAVPVVQPKENKTGLLETIGKTSVSETPYSRRNLLPSQNPLLANILFPSTSSSTPSSFTSSFSVSNSLLQYENVAKASTQWSCEESQHQHGSIALGRQTSLEQPEEQFLDNKSERLMKCSPEAETQADPSIVSSKAPPAYSQQPHYVVAAKDMTRVNRVIEDIYKFPDEGEESSPPPLFAGFKSQKFNFVQYGHRKPSEKVSSSSNPQTSECASNSALHKSNMKLDPFTDQITNGHPASKSCLSVGLSSSHIWKSPKKLKAKKPHEKSNKFNPKKVQFSDVVTSKSASEYGQSITVSSNIDTIPNEVPSNYGAPVAKRGFSALSGIQYPLEINQHIFEKLQNTIEESQDDQFEHERHPYVAEHVQKETRESKLRTCHSGQCEAILTRSGNVNDPACKTFGLAYMQREEDGLSDSDVGAGHQHAREDHKVLLHHQLPKVNQKASVTHLTDYEQGLKQKGDRDTGPVQAFRHIDQSPYTYQSVFVQDNMGNLSAVVSDKTEAHLHNVSSLRTSDQMVVLKTYGNLNNQCDDSRAEGSHRDLTKRRRLAIHDERFQFNTASEYGNDATMERKHYISEEEFVPLSPNSVTGNDVRDSEYDQQSSFNILSSQGYSKLSRQRMSSRTHHDHPWVESSTPSVVKGRQLTVHVFDTDDTSCSLDQFENVRSVPQQTRFDPVVNVNSAKNVERQLSESPLIRHKILESNFELAHQMKKGHVHILKDSESEALEGRQMESPLKFIVYPERRSDGFSTTLIQRDAECQINKELEFGTLSGPASKLTSPIFSDSLEEEASDVLSSIASLTNLSNQIKDLTGENQYLKIKVAKAEKQRKRHRSSSDKHRGLVTDVEKIYYKSPPGTSSQPYVADNDGAVPPRKRHSSSTATVGALNCLINNTSLQSNEPSRPEEGFQNRVINPSLIFSKVHHALEPDLSYMDGSLRGKITSVLNCRNMNNTDDYSTTENYIRDTRDPFVSSSMSNHSRPTSQLDLGMPQYESVRHRYPSSEIKLVSSRGISDGDSFVPVPEHTRHRNLSSSLGLRVLSDIDPPSYDVTQRQRNLSSSSLKSSYQDVELPSFDQGIRSRNPSSSALLRYCDFITSDINFTSVRSRNPSGSSSRRSRPGSSSSDRELIVNMDELPLFSDFARTRSRNSSGESIEPTVEYLDPQQFMQYTYPPDAHIKRTKH